MSSQLKSEFITRPKKVNGFTGVGALMQNGDDQVCVVCADETVLREQVAKLLPDADQSEVRPQPVTIIQAK